MFKYNYCNVNILCNDIFKMTYLFKVSYGFCLLFLTIVFGKYSIDLQFIISL